jgi:hypothetical protein
MDAPVMKKKYSQLSLWKQKAILDFMKKKVEEHWAMISPLHREEGSIEKIFSSLVLLQLAPTRCSSWLQNDGYSDAAEK